MRSSVPEVEGVASVLGLASALAEAECSLWASKSSSRGGVPCDSDSSESKE